jgi:hypothetical protein
MGDTDGPNIAGRDACDRSKQFFTPFLQGYPARELERTSKIRPIDYRCGGLLCQFAIESPPFRCSLSFR